MQRMNELGWDDAYGDAFIGGDTVKVVRQVEAMFRDAWRKAVTMLPRSYFRLSSFKDSMLTGDVHSGTGFVVIPDDFYVLLLFKMKGWQRPCFVAVEEDEAVSAIQSNEFVRGNFCHPVCTLSERTGYGRVLNYYSLRRGENHAVEEALYIPMVGGIDGLEAERDLGLDERLYGALEWINAGLVFSVFEKPDMAKVADEKAKEVASKQNYVH